MADSKASLSRRALLLGGAVTAGALTLRYRRPAPEPVAPTPERAFTEAERQTLEAAQDRLLPSAPGSPGARDVRAIAYLEHELGSPGVFPSALARVKRGAARLDALARAAGAASFAALAEARRDELLRAFEDEDDGPAWFETMLDFTLEAFLGDPVHGGNVGEVAWKWLGHTPGLPRPKGAP